MAVEMLSYADLAARLKISPEAARALAKRHRLPRSRSNDGKTLVTIDLTEIDHKPLAARSPGAHHGTPLWRTRADRTSQPSWQILEPSWCLVAAPSS